jgi:hypothetical protein
LQKRLIPTFVSTSSESCSFLTLIISRPFSSSLISSKRLFSCLLSFGNNFDKLYQWFVQKQYQLLNKRISATDLYKARTVKRIDGMTL